MVAVFLAGRGAVGSGLDQPGAGGQFDGDIEAGVELLDGVTPPGLEVVDPTNDVVLDASQTIRCDGRGESIVADGGHRGFAPLSAASAGGHPSPSHCSCDDVVSVGEHVGSDQHRFADRGLRWELAAVDHRPDRFDDDA